MEGADVGCAIAKGGGDPGETVRVESHDGAFLAWGAFSPQSRIRVRVWSFEQTQRIDAPFLASLVKRAVELRANWNLPSDGVRLVHGESDGLPGLVVDRYGDTLVAQFTSCGTERWKAVLADALLEKTGGDSVGEVRRNLEAYLDAIPELLR